MTEPAKLGFFGPLKTLESATWGIEELPKGSVRAWIDHATMPGVTPEIMRWWFENIDSRTTYNGTDFNGPEVPVYRYWHPFDHIRVRWEKKIPGPDGRIGPGSIIHIQETIGDRYPVDARARVTRFDDEAFNFELLVGGVAPAGEVLHLWEPADVGLRFRTQVTIGPRIPIIGRLLTRIARRLLFSDAMLRDWIRHNIEESGETEKFVPALYTHAMAASQ